MRCGTRECDTIHEASLGQYVVVGVCFLGMQENVRSWVGLVWWPASERD